MTVFPEAMGLKPIAKDIQYYPLSLAQGFIPYATEV
jgi:hypothetical protein